MTHKEIQSNVLSRLREAERMVIQADRHRAELIVLAQSLGISSTDLMRVIDEVAV